jgi:hypothetical protein
VRRFILFCLTLALVVPIVFAPGAHATPGTAPLRIHAIASCETGPVVDVTISNTGKRRIDIFDVHVRMTPVQPGPGGLGVEVFILLTPDASRLSPGEEASFGLNLAGYELPGKRLLVDVAVFIVDRRYPASIRVTAPGCPGG